MISKGVAAVNDFGDGYPLFMKSDFLSSLTRINSHDPSTAAHQESAIAIGAHRASAHRKYQSRMADVNKYGHSWKLYLTPFPAQNSHAQWGEQIGYQQADFFATEADRSRV